MSLPRATPIVQDGLIADPRIGEGRCIPVLVLDSEADTRIKALIEVHYEAGPGDVTTQWQRLIKDPSHMILRLSFLRPAAYETILRLEIGKRGMVIDGIVHTHGLMLVAGSVGDQVSTSMEKPRIIIEVPETGFFSSWEKIYKKAVGIRLRRGGLSRKQVPAAVEEYLKSTRQIWGLRTGQRLRSNSIP